MADGQLTARPVRAESARIALRVGLIYFAARLVTTGFLLLATALAGPGSRIGANPSLADIVLAWDGQWYWLIAVSGYPTTLPLTDDGGVAENAWAFLPIFPTLARWVSLPFGHWAAGAAIVSLIAGYAASVVLFHLLRRKLDETASTWAVVFFACGPLAALFHVAYAETLNLLWLFCALWCVLSRRYGWLYALVPLMAFTRPGVLAFSLFLALFGIWRWFTRDREPLRTPEIVHIVVLGLLAAITGFAWQFIADAVTGSTGAYLSTELAWRRNWLPGGDAVFLPFEGFLSATGLYADMWGIPPWLAYTALVACVAGCAAALIFVPQVKALGVELRLWSASYLAYLLLVFFPQSSTLRLLVPLSPLWGAVAVPRLTAWRVILLAGCLAGQWWWIHLVYALGDTAWRVP